jgi:structural maintenance of chromosome 4
MDDESTDDTGSNTAPDEAEEMDLEVRDSQTTDKDGDVAEEQEEQQQSSPPAPAAPTSPTTVMEDDDNDDDAIKNRRVPRLVLTKLVLENFKSYGGIKEIGPFHKCFSAVVGPNGSGKSNVIDALLFVFGKRAKKLRLNKVRELIHNGSNRNDSHKPTFARVSVYMQEIIDTGPGDEDYDIVPHTQVVISRVAKTDNSSSYQLQHKNVAFKEISSFLKERGIDLDNNRFLILQGEVEMISMMPPKGKTEQDEGLLEYLEDIIGSSAYVTDTNEAAIKVEALSELRQEKLHRCKAVEKEKDSLEAAKQEACALLQAERNIRREQNLYYQLLSWQTDTMQQEQYEPQREKLQQQLQGVREQLESAALRISEMENKKGGILKQQQREYDEIHRQLQQTSDDFHQYQRRDAKLEEEIKHCKATLKKLQAKIKTHEKQHQQAVDKEQQAADSIPQLQERLQELAEEKVECDAQLEALFSDRNAVTLELRSKLEAKSQELAPIQQERAVYQNALETAESQVQLLTESSQQAQQRWQQAQAELDSLDTVQATKTAARQDATQEIKDARARLQAGMQEDQVLQEKETQVNQRNKDLLVRVVCVCCSCVSNGHGVALEKNLMFPFFIPLLFIITAIGSIRRGQGCFTV